MQLAAVRLPIHLYIILSKFCCYFADLDECLTHNHKCSHTCHNTPGSYYCDCPPGFRLDPDETGQCRGKIISALNACNTLLG